MAPPTTLSSAQSTTAKRRSRRWIGLFSATAAGAVLWLLAVPVAGIDLDVAAVPGGPSDDMTVSLASVVVSASAASVLGWILLALLERWTRRGRMIWTWVAAVAAILSIAGPLTMAASVAAGVVLAGMHLVTAAVLIPVLAFAPGTDNPATGGTGDPVAAVGEAS